MLGSELVRPLEDDWRAALDGVASKRGWPTSHDVVRLAREVAALSAAYNDPRRARAPMAHAGAARLGFAFARDVPKGAAAVRELVATGALRIDRAPLRVLELGAGLGAGTWGVLRALEASGARGAVEATWVDDDPEVSSLAREIVRARQGAGSVSLAITTVGRSVYDSPWAKGHARAEDRFDLVLVPSLLSELDVEAEPPARAERHAGLLRSLLESALVDRGSLVVVEPALRDRTRHLHRVRDRLVEVGAAGVFAPCTHVDPCPCLAGESDWCHEDLAVDLPPWLVAVARGAGLRWQGLTFSYVVFRRDGASLAARTNVPEAARLRVVSDRRPSKGKLEVFVCGRLDGASPASRVCAARLDRDASAKNASWTDLARGDVVLVSPAMGPSRPRIGKDTAVHRLGDAESH